MINTDKTMVTWKDQQITDNSTLVRDLLCEKHFCDECY
jgi:hypothetical protein